MQQTAAMHAMAKPIFPVIVVVWLSCSCLGALNLASRMPIYYRLWVLVNIVLTPSPDKAMMAGRISGG